MEIMLWNALLTTFIALLGWNLKAKSDEIQRLQVLLNRTREEVAKEYVTKVDVHNDINRVLDSLTRLDAKLDAFIREQKNALG